MYLLSSDVQHNGDFVARLEGIADPKIQWMNDRNARLDFENDVIKFSLNMSLAAAKDIHRARLLLGVGTGIDFSTKDGWNVTMLPQTWAALVQKNTDGFLVAIPEPFPIRRGKVPLDVKLADGLPTCKMKEENKTEDNRGILIPNTRAWCPNQSIIESTVRSLCKEKMLEYESKRVYMKPDLNSPSFDPNKGSIETCAIAAANGNFVEIIAYGSGFMVKGYAVKLKPVNGMARANVKVPAGSLQVSSDVTRFRRSRVSFKIGTKLYFQKDNQSFATIKKNITGHLIVRKICTESKASRKSTIVDKDLFTDVFTIEVFSKIERQKLFFQFRVQDPKMVQFVEQPHSCDAVEGFGENYGVDPDQWESVFNVKPDAASPSASSWLR